MSVCSCSVKWVFISIYCVNRQRILIHKIQKNGSSRYFFHGKMYNFVSAKDPSPKKWLHMSLFDMRQWFLSTLLPYPSYDDIFLNRSIHRKFMKSLFICRFHRWFFDFRFSTQLDNTEKENKRWNELEPDETVSRMKNWLKSKKSGSSNKTNGHADQ